VTRARRPSGGGGRWRDATASPMASGGGGGELMIGSCRGAITRGKRRSGSDGGPTVDGGAAMPRVPPRSRAVGGRAGLPEATGRRQGLRND
jgi:hypothetical protein